MTVWTPPMSGPERDDYYAKLVENGRRLFNLEWVALPHWAAKLPKVNQDKLLRITPQHVRPAAVRGRPAWMTRSPEADLRLVLLGFALIRGAEYATDPKRRS